VLDDPLLLVLLADHEAGDVLQEHERHVALVAELDELRALLRALREEDPVVREDADRVTVDVGPAADELGPYSGLNSLKREPSTMRAMISRASNGMRTSADAMPRRSSLEYFGGSTRGRGGGPAFFQLRCATISRPRRIASSSFSAR
jgi:hypothetical protein